MSALERLQKCPLDKCPRIENAGFTHSTLARAVIVDATRSGIGCAPRSMSADQIAYLKISLFFA
jgi:hypothetical protein